MDFDISSIEGKRICITGAKGFLGQHLVRYLSGFRRIDLYPVGHKDYDLTSHGEIKKLYENIRPDIVIHLAAVVGGIGANTERPAEFFYHNAIMGLQLLHQAYAHNVGKFVSIGTICSYPRDTETPFKEREFWEGYPEESNAPYGLAKKMLLVQNQAYRKQYGFNGIYIMPVNLYGPGDKHDLRSSHVIPALIKKCIEAKRHGQSHIEVWGTGNATREFLYVGDAVEAIVRATALYNDALPVIVGSGIDITIRKLAQTISEITGFGGQIQWNGNKPDGQPSRLVDSSFAFEKFGFKAVTKLQDGLEKTVEWYENILEPRC